MFADQVDSDVGCGEVREDSGAVSFIRLSRCVLICAVADGFLELMVVVL